MSTMKKFLAMAVVFVMVFGMMVPAFALGSDVVGTEYEGAAAKLGALGIMVGDAETGNFRPYDNIKRSEFAKIAVVALGLEGAADAAKGATPFADVVENHWASGYINIASAQKIIVGDGDGNFRPDDNISYAEALTILVRVLGYGPAVEGKGIWPINYIAKSADIKLTDGISVNSSAKAIRGVVAQLTENALTIPMLVQIGYGDSAEYVVSGSRSDIPEETLLETKLDVENVTEAVVAIPRIDDDLDDNEIELETAGVVTVPEGFDFEGTFGAKIKVYINDDTVISYELDEDVILDGAEWLASDNKLKLIEQDDEYTIKSDAVVYVNGSSAAVADAEADFDLVKVIVNDDDEITFIEAWNWDDSILVEDIDDGLVIGTDSAAAEIELDTEDFTIVKAGKVISVDDIKEGDILYYNEDEEYAEVYADTVTGELEENDIFSAAFELNGDEYDIFGTYVDEDGEIATLTTSALEDMAEADDNEITLYLDRLGNIRFVDGNLKVDDDEDETFAGYLTEDMTVYTSRNKDYVAIDMVNENGAEVQYDVELTADVLGLDAAAFAALDTDSDGAYDDEAALATAGAVIEVTIDEDGDVTEINYNLSHENFDAAGVEDDMVELDDNYIGSRRLSNSAIVFLTEDYTDDVDDIVVTTWGDVDQFELVDVATVYYDTDGYVDYLVVTSSDAEENTENKNIVVSEVKILASGDYRIDGYIDGEEVTLYTDDEEFTIDTTVANAVYGDLLTVTVDKDTNNVVNDTDASGNPIDVPSVSGIDGTITAINYGDKEITVGGNTYKLVDDGYVYDATDSDDVEIAKLRDLHVGDTVRIYLDKSGTVFAKHVVLFTEAD